jgi:drug/metabolite transporter (DMT)-like permease
MDRPASPMSPSLTAAGDARHGILWMLLTMFLFVAMDGIAKYLVQTYPVVQVVWARYTFHVALLIVWIGARLPRLLVTYRPGLQFARSLLLLLTTAFYFLALSFIPLAEGSAIMMISPLLVTALSMPLLGEHVGPRRWAGVAAGFVGAMLIIRPGSEMMQVASLLALAAAFCNGLYHICTRILSQSEHVLTTLVYSASIGALASTLAVPFFWVSPDAWGWFLMVAVGLLGGLSHFALIKAFAAAPAATVAPFTYTNLLWAALIGYLAFGDLPDSMTVLGATIIAGSGLYIFHREHVRRRDINP